MKQTTLCFLVKGDSTSNGEVLLAMKKRGFGVGKWNGVGGKLKPGEGFEDAAVREIWEEIYVRIAPKDLAFVAPLKFEYRDNPDWHQKCHVFLVRVWQGEPSESEEMKPQWYAIDKLPFDAMWIDDLHWLPRVLAGEKLDAKFVFNSDGSQLIDFSVDAL